MKVRALCGQCDEYVVVESFAVMVLVVDDYRIVSAPCPECGGLVLLSNQQTISSWLCSKLIDQGCSYTFETLTEVDA